jgi:ubiquinone/menaquinone biosynthesis C-methylase UbiE
MTTFKDILGDISGGKVLDVATGNGSFIGSLLEGLKNYDEITGVDINDKHAAAFVEAFKDKPNVRFKTMDAEKLDFPDASIDTACISNSLHHMPSPEIVLAEMKRVLRPGGHLIVSEMYRDHQTEAQMTHVDLHHWWAAVNTVNGIFHNETYTRQELLDLVKALGLRSLSVNDLFDLTDDPKDAETVQYLNDIIDQYIQRAEGHPDLLARGAELRQRVAEIGFHSATVLIAVGER